MTVEAATYIADLVATNPGSADYLYEGDDHMRLLKAVQKASFPNITGPVNCTPAELNLMVGMTTAPLTASTLPAGAWVLRGDTTISGSPTAVDFVHGTGGVVLDASSDEYLVQYEGIWANALSTAAEPELLLSINGGSTWTFLGNPTNGIRVYATSAGALTAAAFTGGNRIKLYAGQPVVGTCSGSILFRHRKHASTPALIGSLEAQQSPGGNWSVTAQFDGQVGVGTTPINGIRIGSSVGNFGTYGRIRLYSRKTA